MIFFPIFLTSFSFIFFLLFDCVYGDIELQNSGVKIMKRQIGNDGVNVTGFA